MQVVLNRMALHSQRAQTLRALIMKSQTNTASSSTNLPGAGTSEERVLGQTLSAQLFKSLVLQQGASSDARFARALIDIK